MLKRDLVFCRRDWKTLGFLYLKCSSQERTETPKAGGRKGVQKENSLNFYSC